MPGMTGAGAAAAGDGHAGKTREDKGERRRGRLAGNDANHLNTIFRREEKVGDGARGPLDVDVERALQPIDACESDDVEWCEAIEIAHSGMGVVAWGLPSPSMAMDDGEALRIPMVPTGIGGRRYSLMVTRQRSTRQRSTRQRSTRQRSTVSRHGGGGPHRRRGLWTG